MNYILAFETKKSLLSINSKWICVGEINFQILVELARYDYVLNRIDFFEFTPIIRMTAILNSP